LSGVLLSNLHFLRFFSSIQVLAYHPSDEGALANYAVLCTAKGEYTTAESLYRSALMSQPRHLVLMTNYAHLLHHQVTPPRKFAVEGFVFRVEGSRWPTMLIFHISSCFSHQFLTLHSIFVEFDSIFGACCSWARSGKPRSSTRRRLYSVLITPPRSQIMASCCKRWAGTVYLHTKISPNQQPNPQSALAITVVKPGGLSIAICFDFEDNNVVLYFWVPCARLSPD
jgi:hypothetical protein